jgi:hypothetical protein
MAERHDAAVSQRAGAVHGPRGQGCPAPAQPRVRQPHCRLALCRRRAAAPHHHAARSHSTWRHILRDHVFPMIQVTMQSGSFMHRTSAHVHLAMCGTHKRWLPLLLGTSGASVCDAGAPVPGQRRVTPQAGDELEGRVSRTEAGSDTPSARRAADCLCGVHDDACRVADHRLADEGLFI